MRETLFISIIVILICSSSAAQTGNNKIRYFDENNLEISKSKFNRMRSTNKLLAIPGDSVNHEKLISREERGKINDRISLELLLESASNR